MFQVNGAVNATVMDISRNLERRLADKLASKQDVQALSIRVSKLGCLFGMLGATTSLACLWPGLRCCYASL